MTDVVSPTVAAWARRRRTVLLTASLAAVLAGCSVRADPGATESVSPPGNPGTAPGTAVVLRFGDNVAAATLTDTPPARQFAAMLPLTLQLKDVWGQAKSGRLPRTLAAEGSTPVYKPTPGDIYFWPQTEVVAIYYNDLGRPVPGPGLVRLGAIDAGLDGLANAGKRVTVRIELPLGCPSSCPLGCPSAALRAAPSSCPLELPLDRAAEGYRAMGRRSAITVLSHPRRRVSRRCRFRRG
ncbi:MAG TPA: cyclophilin-like fold protein [Candidatus Limnocylindrales bacterium]